MIKIFIHLKELIILVFTILSSAFKNGLIIQQAAKLLMFGNI